MDKNQKSANTQSKSGTATHGDKESVKQNTSSKKMMYDKSDTKSEDGMHASSGKSAMGNKTSKGK
jgi:hypothetical protein